MIEKNAFVNCRFCGRDKPAAEMKSFQIGFLSGKRVGICRGCFSLLGVRSSREAKPCLRFAK